MILKVCYLAGHVQSEGFMVQCKLQVETANDIDYCFRIQMFENRCEMNTVWKPFTFGTKSCMWVRGKHNSKVKTHSKMLQNY